MTTCKILRMGHPLLMRPSAAVTAFNTPPLHALVQDLQDTMASAGGVGIAAPQIGDSQRVVVFGFPDFFSLDEGRAVPHTVLINPLIEPLDEQKEYGWEGCLSLPGLRGWVPRYTRIRYSGFDPTGTPIDVNADGYHARVVQHECDHLDGILYPMRMTDLATLGYTEESLTD